jgi:hypothetical protein
VPVGLNDMSKSATGKTVRYSRDNLPPSRTDWDKVMAMTDEEIRAWALADPDAQPMTAEELARMRPALQHPSGEDDSSPLFRWRRVSRGPSRTTELTEPPSHKNFIQRRI